MSCVGLTRVADAEGGSEGCVAHVQSAGAGKGGTSLMERIVDSFKMM